MDIINVRFESSIQRAGLVKSFRFLPENSLDFQPGQFARIIFDRDNLGNRELNKYLSFSCPPGKDYLEFTKKLSGSLFSQKLENLKKGDEISIQAPLGSCVFKSEYKKIAFLIGGIGITPVISILGYIAGKKLKTDAVLFYSNKDDSEIAFQSQLNSLEKKHKNIRVIYTVTGSKPKKESILPGRINRDIVLSRLKDAGERIFFIFGPPKMVEAMNRLCNDIGCSKDKIKREGFIGY